MNKLSIRPETPYEKAGEDRQRIKVRCVKFSRCQNLSIKRQKRGKIGWRENFEEIIMPNFPELKQG